MIENFKNIGPRLRERMNALQLKQVDVCKITGLSKNAISNYINGKRIPDTLAVYKLAQALQVSIEWLLTGKEQLTNGHHPSANLNLSPREIEIIKTLRQLDERDQKETYEIIKLKYERTQQSKKGLSSNLHNGNSRTEEEAATSESA